jgi:hypothetical protein
MFGWGTMLGVAHLVRGIRILHSVSRITADRIISGLPLP